ncbi:unnamed protein product [Darwinula stevensoni]|uniref:Uncharacterized protein n=1 Tax=Darwinula stevensoni TaxID=69355 RepID=A0A7R9AG22_9CRUS|nr:unnamed protein product [Darwinula stevensoni]CAG0903877.1 unnamed protein product [Darwinula stevensoni]
MSHEVGSPIRPPYTMVKEENRRSFGNLSASASNVKEVWKEDISDIYQKPKPEKIIFNAPGMRATTLAENMKASSTMVEKGTEGNLKVYQLPTSAIVVDRKVGIGMYKVGPPFLTRRDEKQ